MSSRIDEFRATYKRMVDEELLELADEMDQLTEEAQIALRAELSHRGIAEEGIEAQKAEAPQSNAPAEPNLPEWGFFGAKTPELQPSDFVAVFSAGSDSEAEQVQESLRDAGIESQFQIVILVRQADSERAFDVLSERLDADQESGEEDEDGDDKNIDPEEED